MEKQPVGLSESELHNMLTETGKQLYPPPSDVNQLLQLLDSIEEYFSLVDQDPSLQVRHVLLPAATGLISVNLLKHPDKDVRVSVISCIHELSRIAAPNAPYEDEIMKEIFEHTIAVLGNLSLFHGRYSAKALHIIECIAKVRSGLVLLELGCDTLIIQIFQLFLDTIRPNHSDTVFSNMEEIMTLLIEESEEISLDLLMPLLTSVKKENQNVSPLSWRLGEKVLKNCSNKVKPYLVKVAEQMRRDIEAYTDIVASIWPDLPAEEDAIKTAPISASELVLMHSSGTDNIIEEFVVAQPSTVGHEQRQHLQIIPEEIPKRRGKKPVSLTKSKEVCKLPRTSGGRTSEVSRKRERKLKSVPKKLSLENPPLQSRVVVPYQTFPRIGQSKDKDSMQNEKDKNDIKCDSEMKEKKPAPKKLSLENPSLQSRVVIPYQTFPRIGQSKDKDSMQNVKDKNDIKCDSEMKEKTRAPECNPEESVPQSYINPGDGNEYLEELIGSRVKVWWPDDQEFYEGVVESYDPLKKEHKVVYIDGDVEFLILEKEHWLRLDNTSNSSKVSETSALQVPTSSIGIWKYVSMNVVKEEEKEKSV